MARVKRRTVKKGEAPQKSHWKRPGFNAFGVRERSIYPSLSDDHALQSYSIFVSQYSEYLGRSGDSLKEAERSGNT